MQHERYTRVLATIGALVVFALAGMASADELPADRSDAEAFTLETMLGPVAEVPCEPEAIPGGIQCLVADRPVFELLHPTLFLELSGYRERDGAISPADPVRLDDAYYYGVHNDLLRFDPHRRAVVDRTPFPGAIRQIEAGEKTLEVTIEAPAHRTDRELTDTGDVETVVIDHDPGEHGPPARAPWDWMGTLGALQDAMWLEGIDPHTEPGGDAADSDAEPADHRRALGALDWQKRRETTNPYVPLYRGEVLERLGDTQKAVQALENAVEHPHATWVDSARIALRLELRDHPELAERAHERALEQMEHAGVRGEYVTAPVHAASALVWMRQGFADAIARGDVDTADRMARRVDEMFPRLEGAGYAWQRLARFFDEHGHADRAQHWQTRSEQLGDLSPHPDRVFEGAVRGIDLYLALQIALLLTAVLAGAILGLWRYGEEDESEVPADDGSGFRQYLPRFNPADLLMLAGVFAALVFLPMMVAPKVQSMVTIGEAPVVASGDALAAPAVSEWATELAESPARDELLHEARAELEATKLSTRGPGDAEPTALLVESVRADTDARQIRRLGDVQASEAALQQFDWLRTLIELEFDTRMLVMLVVVLGLNALIFGGLLQAVARRWEPARRFGRMIVPGAPNSLRVLRLPVLAAFVVGVVLMTPISRMVQSSTEVSMILVFGLDQAPTSPDTTLATTGFALVVVALVIHAIGVVRDRRATD